MASNEEPLSEREGEELRKMTEEIEFLSISTEIVQPLFIRNCEMSLEKLKSVSKYYKKMNEEAAEIRAVMSDLGRVVEQAEQEVIPTLQVVPQLQKQVNNLLEVQERRSLERIQMQSKKSAVMNEDNSDVEQLLERLQLAKEFFDAEIEHVQVAKKLLDAAEKKKMDDDCAFIIKMLTIRDQLLERNAKITDLVVQIKNAEVEKDKVHAENKAAQSQLKLFMTGMNAHPLATSSSSADGVDSSLTENPTSNDTANQNHD